MKRVVITSFHLDREKRQPEELLAAWPTLVGVAGAVARAGMDVGVVQPAHRDAVVRRDGVEYRFVKERPALLRRGTPGTRPVRAPAAALVAAVADLAPEVVHVSGLSLASHARRLKRRMPDVKILAQDHADRPPFWRRPATRRAMLAYDAVAFTASAQAEPFFEAGLFPPGLPVHEVPESSTRFAPAAPERARRSSGIGGDPCLVWVGHLNANKDPLTVLDGLAGAVAHLPDPHLWCCYLQAPLLPEVERRVANDPRLSGRVHLMGARTHEEVETLLQGADALVLGSHREGSGFAVIEALACGATPVVTDIPPFRRLTGEVGLRWVPDDASSLRDALRRLVEVDADGRRRRVRRHFEREVSWPAVGRRLLQVYRTLLDERPEAGSEGP